MHVDAFLGLRVNPATEDAAAWKHERVNLAGCIEDGQFEVAVEGRTRCRLPFHRDQDETARGSGLDPDHILTDLYGPIDR